MAEVSGERSMAHSREQIVEEHRRILDMTQRIKNAPDLVELLQRFQEFRLLLKHHFEGEEAPDGFYDFVRSTAPEHLARLDQLEKEHQTLLSEIDRLADRARACLKGPVAEILKQAGDLGGRVHEHEASENRLLLDAIYTDDGQGD